MPNFKHYIPILRWKTAEKEALRELNQKQKESITPLLELVMPPRQRPKEGEKVKTNDEHNLSSIEKLKIGLPDLPIEIKKYWGERPIFIDLNFLINNSLKTWGYKEIMDKAYNMNLSVIPVIRIDDDSEVEKIVIDLSKKHKSGLCLRVLHSDFSDPNIGNRINSFLTTFNLPKEDVDLFIDFELVGKITENEYSRMTDFIDLIPDINKWRTFTVAGGAFPFDLSEFVANNTYRIPRLDWLYWFNKIYKGRFQRKPAFADYTIQHPIYVEPNPNASPSASIRYTGDDNWVIVRGEALSKVNGAGHSQYPSQAFLLTQEKEFKGKNFSFGDNYIQEKSEDVDTKETGNPRTWLRAGVNHHLALVVSQVSNLL